MISTTTFKENNVPKEETVTISKSEYESLLDDAKWREAFEAVGVDNWEGASDAWKVYEGVLDPEDI